MKLIPANDNWHDFYVYAWLRPCGTPFYIGKGRGRRAYVYKRQNLLFDRIVKKMRLSGHEPSVEKWIEGISERDAFDLERAYIRLFGRVDDGTGILSNMTDGGEGVGGMAHSDDAREKMSRARRGRKFSDEHKAKISAAQKGKPRQTHSAETKAKMSASRTGKKLGPRSDETRAKISASKIGKKHGPQSQETRDKIGAAQRGRIGISPGAETRERLSAATTAAKRIAPPISGFKGVSAAKSGWVARITTNRVTTHLGTFASPETAARAYDSAANDNFGVGNCYINFPKEAA